MGSSWGIAMAAVPTEISPGVPRGVPSRSQERPALLARLLPFQKHGSINASETKSKHSPGSWDRLCHCHPLHRPSASLPIRPPSRLPARPLCKKVHTETEDAKRNGFPSLRTIVMHQSLTMDLNSN